MQETLKGAGKISKEALQHTPWAQLQHTPWAQLQRIPRELSRYTQIARANER